MKRTIGILTLALLTMCSSLALAQMGRRAVVGEVSSLSGVLVDDQRPVTTLKVGDEEIVLHMGPRWFWARQGVEPKAGQTVEVLGELVQEDGGKHLYAQKLTLGDRTIELADEAGIPLWARGHGRAQASGAAWTGKGRGHGRGNGACSADVKGGRGGRGLNQDRPARTCWRG